jgi:hypothetical protein
MNKKTTRLIIIAAMLTVLTASLYLVKRVQETRRGAVGTGNVQLSFSPSTTTLSPGQQTNVSIMMSSSSTKQIHGAEIIFSYDDSVFEINESSITCGNTFPSLGAKKVTSSKAQIACYLSGTGDAFSFSSGQEVVLATFNVTARPGIADQSSTLSFIDNIVPEVITEENLSDSGTATTFTITSGGGLGSDVISFSIDSVLEVEKGKTYTADVLISNISDQDLTIQSAEARVGFDEDVFAIDEEGIVCNSSQLASKGAIVSQSGSFTLSCYNSSDTVSLPAGGKMILGSFDLSVRTDTSVSSSTLSFTKGKVPIPGSTGSLLSQLVNKTYNITQVDEPSPGDDPTMSFKIKFNRVNWQIPDQEVLVKVVGSGFKKEFSGVEVTSDEDGILSGSLELTDVLTGGGYQIIIKGPKHLAEKFCADGQQGRCQWGQSITLTKTNDFDFSGFPLEPGDIPDANGIQDGVVDGRDFEALKSALNSSDEALRERVNLDFDINDDGEAIISGRDISVFLETMGRRYDDDN